MMIKCFLFALTFCFCVNSSAQIVTKSISTQTLPKSISVKGELTEAFQFADQTTSYYIILSKDGPKPSKNTDNEDNKDASLFAHCYSANNGTIALLWKVQDFVKTCPFDIECRFAPNSFSVTDLNNNGEAEIWLVYSFACRSDVSPADMKIIMYEGKNKFAMRGTTKTEIEKGKFEGGNYTFDKALEACSKEIKDFARVLWDKHSLQKWD